MAVLRKFIFIYLFVFKKIELFLILGIFFPERKRRHVKHPIRRRLALFRGCLATHLTKFTTEFQVPHFKMTRTPTYLKSRKY